MILQHFIFDKAFWMTVFSRVLHVGHVVCQKTISRGQICFVATVFFHEQGQEFKALFNFGMQNHTLDPKILLFGAVIFGTPMYRARFLLTWHYVHSKFAERNPPSNALTSECCDTRHYCVPNISEYYGIV